MAPRPPRVTLGALSTGETLEAQYNPETFEEDIAAAYTKVKVQGLSHTVLQYEHTESWTSTFDLAFDALSSDRYDSVRARNLLQSWLYPTRGAGSVASGGPDRVKFVWPGLVSLSAVIMKLKFKHKRFAWTGVDLNSTWYVVTVTLEEIRDTRLFADEVAARGTLRTST